MNTYLEKAKHVFSIMVVAAIAAAVLVGNTRTAQADHVPLPPPPPPAVAPGDLLATVGLPGNAGFCSVAGTFNGQYYMTIEGSNFCGTDHLQIYLPPAGTANATPVATKNIVDGNGDPLTITALSWDSSRNRLWAAHANGVYLIDVGDPTVSDTVTAVFQFNPNVGGLSIIDGLAWDANDDTLYHSPDVNLNVYQFSLGPSAPNGFLNPPLGTLLNTVAPQNADGEEDGSVSGVAIGAGNTLYIGRNGFNEIRRVNKSSGAFVSTFATTAGRVEDLVCDPVNYAPHEAILAKDSNNHWYEAFLVETGTCPLAGEVITCTKGFWKNHAEEWTNLNSGDMPTWGGGLTYMEILHTSPKKGDASVILAHAYIAATLNSGAPMDALNDALTLLMAHPVGSGDLEAKGKNTDPDRGQALGVAAILQEFNESLECPLPMQ